MNEEYFEQLGRLIGPLPERQAAFGCDSCQTIWYGYEEAAPDGRHPRPDSFCPHCGSETVRALPEIPGALALKSWIDWPEDCPSMEADTEPEPTQADQTAGRRPPQP